MSKYGDIAVNVYDVYKKENLLKFAKQAGITLQQAESLARERIYRAKYAKMRNKDPQVRAKRKEYNQKRYELRKLLG